MATHAVVATLFALAMSPAVQALKIASLAPAAPMNVSLLCKVGAPDDEHDQWYEEQKAKIDKECKGMRDELDKEFENKMQEGVNGAKANANAAHAAEDAAKNKVKDEKGHWTKEHEQEMEANDKLCDMEGDAQACKDNVNALKKKREAIRKLVEAKKECVEELRNAEYEMARLERKLCVAKAKAEREQVAALAKQQDVDKETGHVEYEKNHVAEANLRLVKANAEVEVAEKELAAAKAKRDGAKKKLSGGPADAGRLVAKIGSGNVIQVHNKTNMPL